jgi:tRNA-modifying protein YgfZ
MAFGDILLADVSERGKLRFAGEQRAWFLHQIVTNRFEDIEVGDARAAAMLTVHGRMVGFFDAVATDDALLAHMEPELLPGFTDALRRYVFATQVEIEDVTNDFGLVVLVGDGWRDLAGKIEASIPHETQFIGPPAGHIWVPRGNIQAVIETAARAGARVVAEEEIEQIRIAHGRPRWGRDMNEKTIPQEARLEEFGALDFNKGCYVGQEAVAKIYFRGKVNRKVRRLSAAAPLSVGAEVTKDEEKIGTVTSAAGGEAIAVLKHTVEPGESVTAGGVDATVAG